MEQSVQSPPSKWNLNITLENYNKQELWNELNSKKFENLEELQQEEFGSLILETKTTK